MFQTTAHNLTQRVTPSVGAFVIFSKVVINRKAYLSKNLEIIMSKINVLKPKILLPENCEAFREFYPNGKIVIALASDMHPEAMRKFEGYSRRFILPREYIPSDFHQFFIVKKGNSEETHIAYQSKTYTNTSGDTERLVYLQDLDESKLDVGHGEIRFNITNKRDEPFVGYTETPEGIRGSGRGTDRLSLMNGLTLVLFGFPIHSSLFLEGHEKGSEGTWKRQIKAGNATRYKSGNGHRYHF